MKIKYVVLMIVVSLALSGCASNQQRTAQREMYNSTIPVCNKGEDCDNKWDAAQIWVSKNCGMKIQLVNDTIIETYNSSKNSTHLAASILREPIGNGKYKITIKTGCNNIFGCVPNALEAAISFNKYVSSM